MGTRPGSEGLLIYKCHWEKKKSVLQSIAGWFSMSPLPRLHHHDIMTIVELFSCNLERCSHTENMDLALGQVPLLTKTF